ncbi:MAG: nitroreductase family deazaflavin-dependent oxidoreductase [Anaerolineae bacterium]
MNQPSAFRDRVRHFNKRFLNKLTIRLARLPRGPFAIIHHIGRRSGKSYETPIIVQAVSGGFVIALTYGPDVDWLHNVRAAGRCEILLHGTAYIINKIEPLDQQVALPAFPFIERFILGRVGVTDFLSMSIAA